MNASHGCAGLPTNIPTEKYRTVIIAPSGAWNPIPLIKWTTGILQVNHLTFKLTKIVSQRSVSGWWFGCHECYFPRNIGLLSSSPLTKSIIFQRGGFKQPPTRSQTLTTLVGSFHPWYLQHLQDHSRVTSELLADLMGPTNPRGDGCPKAMVF